MDLNELEDDEQVEDFEEEGEKIDQNLNNLEENPEENIKNIIFEGFDEKEKTENLINKSLEFYKTFNLSENEYGIEFMKSIFSEVSQFSKFNLSARLIDFFEYILSISGLKFEYIKEALNIKTKDLEKDNHKDITFFWKQFIAEVHLKEQSIFIKSEQMKDSLKSLLEHNFNLNEINYIFLLFQKVIMNEKSKQFDIINSLISTLILYPTVLNERKEKSEKKEEDLNDFIDKYIIKDETQNDEKESTFIFDNKKNVALDFYLKVSSDKSNNDSLELKVPEIIQYLKINNPGISLEKLEIIQKITCNVEYKKYDVKNFKEWTKTKLPELIKVNSDENIAIILGMISLAIKKKRDYFLRNTQLIAVLLFISKEKKKGLIEEISTGEGKSCIICTLSIYFALKGYKVDIISSSYTLAQRDSEDFKELYDYFNLTTSYPFDSKPEPYSADILYGTFLEFEGDYLREITSDMKIRNKRSYDVIIIDEVDNLFVDNILGSTRLTNSSRGFKFLIPIYLTIYLSFELCDYFFMLLFKINLKLVENDERKKKYENLIKNPNERKKELVKILQGNFKEIFNLEDDNNKNNVNQNDIKEAVNKFNKANEEYFEFINSLQKYLECPRFLKSFVEVEVSHWLDSAYDAKNLMEIDRDYVEVTNKYGNRDIAPVDRTNTGEIELSTVYGEGLHQMLEVKHKFRIKDETLVHTFLSHITFFQKYKKKDEFLFFGLTGTIGNEETQKIYENKYIDSKLLFIPQYKKKRFVELPPVLVNIADHFYTICKDIIINFYRGRKILVICNSIKEAKIIEDELKKFNIKPLGLDNDIVNKEDYKESIILYTRSDTEKSNIKDKKKRIILSTNLGGRGTDIQTNEQEEEAGGLHVILTYMPRNYRVLKQAFGRTSREGKKGTAQIILKNLGYKSYSEIKDEMNKNEQNHISYIQKKLRILLFKDKLFEEFIELIKGIDFNGYLIEDINERWAHFLKVNLPSNEEDLKIDEINKKFEDFKKQIKNLMEEEESYNQFENPFYKMQEGLRTYTKYQKSLMKFFDFEEEIKKFYFVQPYVKAIIIIMNSSYNDKFFEDVKINFDESINRINLLIKENIDPILKSFEQWENALNNFESIIPDNQLDNLQILTDIDKPFIDKSFADSDLCKQYTNIKAICNKLIERIQENKKFMDIFQKKYKEDKGYYILVTEEDLEEGLSLSEEEIKEEQFFSDATCRTVYKLSIKKKQNYLHSLLWNLLALGIITLLAGLLNPINLIVVPIAYISGKILFKNNKKGEVSTNSLFGNLFYLILKKINTDKKKKTNKRISAIENIQKDNHLVKSPKNILFGEIMNNIEIKFEEIKKSSEILKFLLFVDQYYSEEIWSERIKNIFKDKFDKVYKVNFNENNFFKTPITNETFDEHLQKYDDLFVKFLDECIREINQLGMPKKFNKKDGINCLEHLIIDFNSEKITEDIAQKIVEKMLEYRLISENGIINKKLFGECFINDKGINLEQTIKINIINNKINKKSIKKISNLKDFVIEGFEIPLVNSAFIDLANFYQINNYNVQKNLEKDFSLYINNNFKKIIINLLSVKPEIFDKFYNYFLNIIKSLIKNLLEEKQFSKYNKSSFENVITSELTEEERVEFNRLIKDAGDNAINTLKFNH